MDPFLEFSEGSGGTAAATSASPTESACATIRALEELQPFEPLAKKGQPQPRLIRQVDTLMARHALHQQCIGELSAVAGAAGEEAKGLPSLLQELGGWHDRLVQEMAALVGEAVREGEQSIDEARARARRAEAEAAALSDASGELGRRVQAAEEERTKAVRASQLAADALVRERRRAQVAAAEAAAATALLPQRHPPAGLASSLSAAASASSAEAGEAARAEGEAAGGGRALTLKAAREFIDELYASKARHDERCAQDAKLLRETVEQHLYSYLNTKYGLKQLITRDVDACLDAVRRFSAEDNDVATFGAILRNEVDEPFRLVQRQLKETVRALLTAHLKGRHPHKSDAQVASSVLAKTRGVVQEEEWRDVVLYMYAPEDAALLLSRLAQKAAALAADSPPRGGGGGAAGGGARPRRSAPRSRRESDGGAAARRAGRPLPYKALLQVLLGFQLDGHRQFLEHFVVLFRSLDTAGRGVLDEDAFRMLVRAIAPAKSEGAVEELLLATDPHDHKRFTFSDCVVALSQDLVALLAAPSL